MNANVRVWDSPHMYGTSPARHACLSCSTTPWTTPAHMQVQRLLALSRCMARALLLLGVHCRFLCPPPSRWLLLHCKCHAAASPSPMPLSRGLVEMFVSFLEQHANWVCNDLGPYGLDRLSGQTCLRFPSGVVCPSVTVRPCSRLERASSLQRCHVGSSVLASNGSTSGLHASRC